MAGCYSPPPTTRVNDGRVLQPTPLTWGNDGSLPSRLAPGPSSLSTRPTAPATAAAAPAADPLRQQVAVQQAVEAARRPVGLLQHRAAMQAEALAAHLLGVWGGGGWRARG